MMEMQEGIEKIYSDDVMYELFDGGRIRPRKVLKNPEDFYAVEQAMQIIENFIHDMEQQGVLEEV